MKIRSISIISLLVVLTLAGALIGCSKAAAPVAEKSMSAPVSDGSEDLKISYQVNTAGPDADNFFSFAGNIRYMAVEMDQADEVSGASKLGSTHLFQPYRYDVEGKNVISSGLRGLFLYGTNPYKAIIDDNLNVSKASDGTITIQYSHRGTAYRIITDSSGKISFPDGSFENRPIGYIKSGAPQVISTDFSSDGTSATVDWNKVWDSKVAGGKIVTEGVDKKTGDIRSDAANPESMFYFDGSLQASLDNDILKINGFLTAVTR
jgi:hypothetical protein